MNEFNCDALYWYRVFRTMRGVGVAPVDSRAGRALMYEVSGSVSDAEAMAAGAQGQIWTFADGSRLVSHPRTTPYILGPTFQGAHVP